MVTEQSGQIRNPESFQKLYPMSVHLVWLNSDFVKKIGNWVVSVIRNAEVLNASVFLNN